VIKLGKTFLSTAFMFDLKKSIIAITIIISTYPYSPINGYGTNSTKK
jgi:hypothetical protein